jgi:pyruvate/2-oxoglutarate dehydrogenase complex dihydrolipoamide acyltransferase (E2) component
MAPEGLLEAWRAADGAEVNKGQAVAEVRIEDAVHEILAPARGLLARSARAGDLVQPGDRIGWVADG